MPFADLDPHSFEFFVHATGPRLHRTALLLCGEHHLAEDLTQTTYAKVFASWGRVRRADSPYAYTRTVLVRTWLSHRRLRRAGEQPTEVLPEHGHEHDPSTRVVVLDALARLAPPDRAVLVLRYYQDLTVAQTAELLEISEAAVRKRSERALARLRPLLPEIDPEDS